MSVAAFAAATASCTVSSLLVSPSCFVSTLFGPAVQDSDRRGCCRWDRNRQSRSSPRSSLFPRDKFRRRIHRCCTILMSMVPVSPHCRSPFLADRLLLLSSARHLQDGRLAAAATRQCHGS